MTSLDNLSAALQGWQNFYMLTGTAAATLTGLMFVAVTFGSSLVTKETAKTARAFLDPTYLHFAQVLLTACLLMIPTLGPSLLGCVLIVVGAARLLGLRRPARLTGLAIVNVSLLLVGIYSAWELLVWKALVVSERRRQPARPTPSSEKGRNGVTHRLARLAPAIREEIVPQRPSITDSLWP